KECVAAGGKDAHILQRDIPIDGEQVSTERSVKRSEYQRVLYIPNADVVIEQVVHESAPAAVGLDADAIVCAVDRQVVNQHVIHAAIRSAADRHAVARIEMVV